jgi:CHAD domain-containing protein
MRVSARRLKAMMKVFRHAFPKRKFRAQYEWIGDLVRALGAVRDCDVFIGLLEEQKGSIAPRGRRSIDLLIARQKTVRSREQRSLHRFIRQLHSRHAAQEFRQFVSKAGGRPLNAGSDDSSETFAEAVRKIVPPMYDQFLSRAGTVMDHPRLTGELHKMRIEGKPLRYVMELLEDRFEPPFDKCLKEIKNLIELMGTIHDCDVMIPRLRNHLQEMRSFNKGAEGSDGKFSNSGILELIRRQRVQRQASFQMLCRTLKAWKSEKFREKLIHSMRLIQYPITHHHLKLLSTHGNIHTATRTGS